jgi:ABC-type bacteriocin/lantibiotic exporter with double-glycine peptidase domain
MPLSPDEQRILEEIEQRLSEEDPRLAEQVARTSLYTHLARRIRWSVLAFGAGFLMLMAFPVLLWVAAVGFCVMLASSLLIYRYLKQLGRDQVRLMQRQSGRFSIAGLLARLAGRFRDAPPPPPQQPPTES